MMTLKFNLLTGLILFLPIVLLAQPTIEWENNYGGSERDYLRSIIQTNDNDYVLAGWSESSDGDVSQNYGKEDYWIVKLNETNGKIIWENNYGGNQLDHARAIAQTKDDGFIVAGWSLSSDGDIGDNNGISDYWIAKLDAKGAIEKEANFGGSDSEQAMTIIQTDDGGYAIAGRSKSSDGDVGNNTGGGLYFDYWVVKLDSNLSVEWENNIGGSKDERLKSFIQTKDGGYAMTGWTESSDKDVKNNKGGRDFYTVKLNSSGEIQWKKNHGGSEGDYAESIIQTNDGGFAIAGYSCSTDGDVSGNNGDCDYWLLKLDSNGALEWDKNYGGSDNDFAYSIIQTNDGGYAVAGKSESSEGDVSKNNGSYDYWVLKLDESGVIEWEDNFGGSERENLESIIQTDDGGFAIAGYTKSSNGDVSGNNGDYDYWVIKLK
ncbi:MAG: T9SS type A sorting domain-containing protein [Bacteroidota bacterium]